MRVSSGAGLALPATDTPCLLVAPPPGATGRFTLRFFGEYMRFENPTVGVSEAVYADSETLS